MKYTTHPNSHLPFIVGALQFVLLAGLASAPARSANAESDWLGFGEWWKGGTHAAQHDYGSLFPPTAFPQSTRQRTAYGNLPLSFEANRGQANDEVKFLSRGPGYGLFLTATKAVFVLRDAASAPRFGHREPGFEDRPPQVLEMKLVGANPRPKVEGLEEMPGRVNYFKGSNPANWRKNVSTYARVRDHEIYPGTDAIYYGNGQQLEYDFILAPGADVSRVQIRFAGVQSVRLDEGGELVLKMENGEIRNAGRSSIRKRPARECLSIAAIW